MAKAERVKTMTGKIYKLIVGHDYALSNETDADSMSDYFPGIWAIGSYKSAIEFAKRYIAEGNQVYVTDYENPKYHAVANKAIKELGINQPLFEEPKGLPVSKVTNGNPDTLAALKRYLAVGKEITISNFRKNAEGVSEAVTRKTSVLAHNGTSVILEKILGGGQKSWFDLGKATDWVFTNTEAQNYYMNHEGVYELSTVIIY